jgi:hypothetical protein
MTKPRYGVGVQNRRTARTQTSPARSSHRKSHRRRQSNAARSIPAAATHTARAGPATEHRGGVPDETAHEVITRAGIVGIGDALFQETPSQTFRCNEEDNYD